MKRLLVVLLLSVAFIGTASAQFEYLLSPRPLPPVTFPHATGIDRVQQAALDQVPNGWFFQATAEVAVTEVRVGINGNTTIATFLDAFGPALSYEHLTVKNGLNYADYSVSLAALLHGQTNQVPVFTPEVALTFGVANNLIQLGPGWDLVQRADKDIYSRWTIHVFVGVSPFLN
jgi:hypothetical protein